LNFAPYPFFFPNMRQLHGIEAEWAKECFGHARLGDTRRTARLVNMATRAAQSPSGKISRAFGEDSECQGAYDLFGSNLVASAALAIAVGEGTARRASYARFVFVAIDGSSLAARAHCGLDT
jgi:hypothetical protein